MKIRFNAKKINWQYIVTFPTEKNWELKIVQVDRSSGYNRYLSQKKKFNRSSPQRNGGKNFGNLYLH